MPNETNSIVLHYERTRLEGVQRDGQIWLRGAQIVTPLGFVSEHSLRAVIRRFSDEFTADEMTLITEQTAGGPQQVRYFSLRGARLLAILARTEPAARFRRWLLDLLEGKAPVGHRPSGTLLEQVEGPPSALAHPMVRAAVDTSLHASAVIAAAFREAREINRRARRQAALAGVSARELRILVERERWQAKRGAGQLPLLHA